MTNICCGGTSTPNLKEFENKISNIKETGHGSSTTAAFTRSTAFLYLFLRSLILLAIPSREKRRVCVRSLLGDSFRHTAEQIHFLCLHICSSQTSTRVHQNLSVMTKTEQRQVTVPARYQSSLIPLNFRTLYVLS